jgi:hypothetical protein
MITITVATPQGSVTVQVEDRAKWGRPKAGCTLAEFKAMVEKANAAAVQASLSAAVSPGSPRLAGIMREA